jgi:ubiquinone/menaquinone biosynthesis C-methylase UbiE
LAPPLPGYVSSSSPSRKHHGGVLDVATGARHTGLAFASYIAEVTAADSTEEMLEETRKLARKPTLRQYHDRLGQR